MQKRHKEAVPKENLIMPLQFYSNTTTAWSDSQRS